MKIHSGWLAAGLLLFALLACNLSKNSNNANNSNKNSNENKAAKSQPTRPANADVYVNRVYMAKDKNGQPGDETTSYEPTDLTVHCIIELNKAKKGTEVRYVWKIWDVEGEKDKEIKTTDYTTNSFENKVHGHLQLPSDWPKGTYRVEVYINGNLDKTIDYTIE
ncbi:MAG TPA: hypothetical protein VNG94_06410 [Pyrinomonadaceae bacterium]|nr:hypothetical protein [Pyrinomonadaceae bacterium]